MSLMASSSSSSSSAHIKRYHVFPSFHGPDVRTKFLSHVRNHFEKKGITTFMDQEIKRGHTIGPELVQAIRESRVSVVLLSKNYGSSSWCLDELVEILKCREDQGQLVMTIFYDVDPSDVRKQTGEFGSAFKKTCEGKTEEKKQRWTEALAYVATIAGEHTLNWTDEAAMVEKFATDVSNKLNVTLSRDFDYMVGLQAHLRKLNSLLCLDQSEVKMIGIWGPAGIGKTTIARALFNQISSKFQLTCFMGNLSGSYRSIVGVDKYGMGLNLQTLLLSEIFDQKDMRIQHLGAIEERLQDQRVLIILDDVDHIDLLKVLANKPSWFGSRSRIIITTEDNKILKAHGIRDLYHVDFPSSQEALEILCRYAFEQSSVPDGFEEVANRVAYFCGNLPLGLRVVGSSLCGESKQEWERQLSTIENSLDRDIVDVLRVGYDRLSNKNQSLFLHIACFFKNYYSVEAVTSILPDSNLDVENGLKTLAAKSLVQFDRWYASYQKIEMHSLLSELGQQIVCEESNEPGKRRFLVDAQDIVNVLANETGTGSVIGIFFDTSEISGDISINGRAFDGMRNLQFLRIYDSGQLIRSTLRDMMGMDLSDLERSIALVYPEKPLPRLRLLHWDLYPEKHLAKVFQLECLIVLSLQNSNLKKLWGGIKCLPNLKEIDLSFSSKLKEIPNFSEITNLEKLEFTGCKSLVELPSSIRNLQKLKYLDMSFCSKLRVIPTNINLASLEYVDMTNCSRLRTFPDISSNIDQLMVNYTEIKDVPASVVGRWSRLNQLEIGSRSLKRLTHVPEGVTRLDLSLSNIKKIPDCVTCLPHLRDLTITGCMELVSLPSLPPSLLNLDAAHCVRLKSVSFSFYEPRSYITLDDCKCVKSEKDGIRVSSISYDPKRRITFSNCVSLDEEARRAIIKQWDYKCVFLPGKEVPADFTHKAKGNSITISEGTFSASSRFKACLLFSLTEEDSYGTKSVCRIRSKGVLINELNYRHTFPSGKPPLLTEHLLVIYGALSKEHRCLEREATTSEIQFEFIWEENNERIIECGVQMLAEEGDSSRSKWNEHNDGAIQVSNDESIVKTSKHKKWWKL